MTCEEIQKRMTPFLDDLLVEGEHQAIHAHLEECGRCKSYVSSTGSLSYQLEELGNVPIPEDLVETILFRFKESGGKRAPATQAAEKGPEIRALQTTRRIAVALGALLLVSMAAGFYFYKTRSQNQPGELNQAGESARPVSPASSPGREPDTLLEAVKTVVYGMKEEERNLVFDRLKQIVEKAGQKDDPLFLISDELNSLLTSINKGQNNATVVDLLRGFVKSRGNDSNDVLAKELRGVLYDAFEQKVDKLQTLLSDSSQSPTSLKEWKPVHRHYHLSQASRRDFLEIVRDEGLKMDYESAELALLYVPAAGLKTFSQRISEMKEAPENFNEPQPETVSGDAVLVTVYMTEKQGHL